MSWARRVTIASIPVTEEAGQLSGLLPDIISADVRTAAFPTSTSEMLHALLAEIYEASPFKVRHSQASIALVLLPVRSSLFYSPYRAQDRRICRILGKDDRFGKNQPGSIITQLASARRTRR